MRSTIALDDAMQETVDTIQVADCGGVDMTRALGDRSGSAICRDYPVNRYGEPSRVRWIRIALKAILGPQFRNPFGKDRRRAAQGRQIGG